MGKAQSLSLTHSLKHFLVLTHLDDFGYSKGHGAHEVIPGSTVPVPDLNK